LAALAELPALLRQADELLHRLPAGLVPALADRRPQLAALLPHAQAAIDSVLDFVSGHSLFRAGDTTLALSRAGGGVRLLVASPPGRPLAAEPIALFIRQLRHSDQRLLRYAELLGLLLGLVTTWTAASFAPPVVLLSLEQAAPQLLTLTAELTASPAEDGEAAQEPAAL
jgi:hypothetical protein